MIIDFHCHIFYVKPASLPALAAQVVRQGVGYGVRGNVADLVEGMALATGERAGEQLIRDMDETGIDVSVCFAMDNLRLDDEAILGRTSDVAALARRFPGRVVPFAGVDPRRKGAPALLRRCVEEYGVRGLKLHPDYGFDITGPEACALLAVAQRYNLVLLTHTGATSPPFRNRLAHPLLLDDVGCEFPELRIVAAHSGAFWHRDWASIAAFNDHMYGDLSAWQMEAVGRHERFCRRLRDVLDMAADRLLFASDWPTMERLVSARRWIEILRELPRQAAHGIRFTPEEIDAVLGGNARRLLGL